MAEYPFVSNPVQASAIAQMHLVNAVQAAMQAAVFAQLKAGSSAPLVIDIPALIATVSAGVQQLATDTQQPVVHPITGATVQPVAVAPA